MSKTPIQSKARDLQRRTGWSYSECLRCVRTLKEAEIETIIKQREPVPERSDDA